MVKMFCNCKSPKLIPYQSLYLKWWQPLTWPYLCILRCQTDGETGWNEMLTLSVGRIHADTYIYFRIFKYICRYKVTFSFYVPSKCVSKLCAAVAKRGFCCKTGCCLIQNGFHQQHRPNGSHAGRSTHSKEGRKQSLL